MHDVLAPAVRGFDLGRLENSLGYNLRRAQLRIFGAFADVAGPHDLTPAQFAVLLLIEANPGIKQIELAAALEVDRSTVVRLVDKCAEAKLVKRGASKLDRRIAPPLLTARGRALLQRLEPSVVREEDAAAGLSPAERATLLKLLKRINRNASGERS